MVRLAFADLNEFVICNVFAKLIVVFNPGRYFNSLQSECFAECFLSDLNMVISAPTGSGKTVLFELCILRLLSRFLSQDGKFNHVKGTLKTIYIAPSKALVQEKHRDWNQKLGSWGISCLELTGDSEFHNRSNMQEADIILTTPEKFDAVTRYRIKDGGLSFFSDIGLLLIDEVHLLNDQRGASLEAIVSRIKMLAKNPEMNSSALARVRFIAVSATIPNVEDLAEWLLVPSQGIKRFGEEMRPVQLTTKVFGYAPAKNDFLFERRLENYIFDILMQCSRGKSALVFCSTRKGAQEAALRLSQTAITFGHSNPFIKSQEQQGRLKEASLSFSDKQMQSCIIFGAEQLSAVGYHNGGLCLKDRNLIEGLFLRGDLQILCTTNTLAHGINLPAHTVVIKSTQFLLLSCMTEHLAAEIVQLTISDISQAIEWMKCSYLYIRMRKNPVNYAVKKNLPSECLEKHMQEICLQKANELQRHGMIWMDEYGFLLKSLEPGRLMTKYYLKFDTMKHIIQTSENCSLEDALHTICRSEEIAWIQLRRNEKKVLNDINIDKEGRLRFHILNETGKRKKRIQTREEKIFILTNDSLTGDPSCHDLSLAQVFFPVPLGFLLWHKVFMQFEPLRISKCMKEYFIHKKNYRGVLNSSLLAKCLYQRLWDDSPYLLKQLSGIGMVTAKALNLAGINSFKTLAEADPRQIEIVTGRKYPFGNHIKESLSSLPPKIEMKMEEIECKRQGKSKLVVTLDRLSQPSSLTKRHCADMVIGSEEDNLIRFHEKIRVEEFSSPYSVTVFVSSPQQGRFTVKADLIFEEYNSKLIHKPGKQRSSYSRDLPREIFVIDDDDKSTAPVPVEEPYDSRTTNKDSMPSFELLDEDMDEGVPAFETDGKEQETISGKTVFDHIRKKSKDFPRLEALDATDTLQEKQNYDTDVVALEDYNISRTLGISNTTQKDMNEGAEEKGCDNVLTEETIFDHIRKKSKNLPAFSTLSAMEFEHTNLEKEPIQEVNYRFQTVLVHESEEKDSMIPRKTGVTQLSESEDPEKHVYGANESAVVNKDVLYNRSSLGAELKVSLLNALSGNGDTHFRDKGRAALQSKGSVNGSRMQLCTTDAMGKARGVTSFLGFKSVFSFL
ncbi:hypothetical protein Sjap_016156 [Stephania japonica]|uniref:DNA 3'-5' helicase n=1 Tax=Stephania japonica TaxID=461633 RepID=A0AAP0IKK0_9MAGN